MELFSLEGEFLSLLFVCLSSKLVVDVMDELDGGVVSDGVSSLVFPFIITP